ncbi:hypothetical protein [Luteibacter sp. 3190]|uniref:hypothetical protein n=1 Tax=Luteibacter sp. 3190 TaxID=2817736 RepID=UPI002854E2BC|nr:hypothetical protein [Luteibacter sp. 3190]MDR6935474.1 hypothetical protein [Luteibacter sp. 3190]
MPRVSGKELISPTTEKVIARTVAISATSIVVKLYDVPLNDLKVLGMELPASLFDSVLFVLVIYHAYSLTVNWVGDLAAFRLWFSEASIWSRFGSNVDLDGIFLGGGIRLLLRLRALEKDQAWPTDYASMTDEDRRDFKDFEKNVELYITRLEHAGQRFSALSWFARYYVWLQSYIFPIVLCGVAIYLLLRYGTFAPPLRF